MSEIIQNKNSNFAQSAFNSLRKRVGEMNSTLKEMYSYSLS